VDSPDDVEDPELVVEAVAAMGNAPLEPSTELTSLCIEEIKDDTCTKNFVYLLDLDGFERISITIHNISLNIEET
jgi:hypothetical protein